MEPRRILQMQFLNELQMEVHPVLHMKPHRIGLQMKSHGIGLQMKSLRVLGLANGGSPDLANAISQGVTNELAQNPANVISQRVANGGSPYLLHILQAVIST